MEMTGWPLVVFEIVGLVLLFLLSPTGCQGFVILRGLRTLFVPRFPGIVSCFLLFILYVHLGFEEEGVERGRRLNAYSFGKVTAGTEPALEKILLHVIGR